MKRKNWLNGFVLSLLLTAGLSETGIGNAVASEQTADSATTAVESEAIAEATEAIKNAAYVGGETCTQCHEQEHKDWSGSYHDLAMQPANDETVLADFNDTRFDYFGITSEFYKRDDTFYVKTDGPDGQLTEYPIAYTFGVYPLQQYLIEFPGGRLQVLNIVWDTRTAEEGGQKWFHLYPDEKITADDELHWTGLYQNWNYMCADCHSTDLQKNYKLSSDTFDTTWSDIDVSCEACHGPGSEHLRWAQNDELKDSIPNQGFPVSFDERQDVAWTINPETGIAERNKPRTTQKEIETCATCHSRRSTAHPGARPGDPLLDHFQVSLLDDPQLYHADGQVNGEVYVYGSFVQSKMYQAGVTCTDCHQPHSLKLRADGDQVCAQCHLPSKFDTESHHMHEPGSEGASCRNCHMPAKTFMGNDSRRDHSFRIPRPDLSETLGTPNVCTDCHNDKSNEWATKILSDKFGEPDQNHYAHALAAGRMGSPHAEALLSKLILDKTQPEIARATAATMLPDYLSQQSAQVLQMVAQSDEPLLGLGLSSAAERIPAQYRPIFTVPLLYDDSRITRGLAAQAMAGLPLNQYPDEVKTRYEEGLDDFVHANQFNADRPEALTNLANFYARQGLTTGAEEYYQKAIVKAPHYLPAQVNLAELYRNQGDEVRAREVLFTALQQVRETAVVQHALGLSYVREKQMDKALEHLALAAQSEGSPARYIYVYGVALDSVGQGEQAVSVLEQGLKSYPGNVEILSALVSINTKLGNTEKARRYQQQLGR